MRDLPRGWVWTTLGEVTESRIGSQGPGGDEFTYIDITSIDPGSKRVAEPKRLKRVEAPGRARQNVQASDVLVSLTRPNRNAVAMLGDENDGAVALTAFHVLRSRSGVEAAWLYYLVQANDFVEAMCVRVQGALYPAIRSVDVEQYPIPLAPAPEQRRILAEIDRHLTSAMAAGRALAAASARIGPTLASAVYSIFRDVWSGPVTAGEAAGWRWLSFGETIDSLRNGISAKPDCESGQPILKISAVRPMDMRLSERRYLDPSEGYEPYQLRRGDLLFTRYNGNPELVGACAAVPEIDEAVLYPDKLIRARLKPGFHPPYFEIAVNNGATRRWLRGRVRTTAGQCGISAKISRRCRCQYPRRKGNTRSQTTCRGWRWVCSKPVASWIAYLTAESA